MQQLIPLCLFHIKIFQFFDIQRQSENIKQNNIEMTFTTKGSEVMNHIEVSICDDTSINRELLHYSV